MTPWLRSTRRRDDGTMTPITPTTHMEPRLNDLDPNDPTVQALAPHDAEERLPPLPVSRGLR